jgi:DsbC/DsbD-like thiol-disulfide interchange protein
MIGKRFCFVAAVVALGLGVIAAQGQIAVTKPQTLASGKAEVVSYLFPEQVSAPAEKSTRVELHFRVAQGMHINSHTPGEGDLIPTTFSIPQDAGARLLEAIYPPGETMSLAADPGTRLNVYTGEFVIRARIVPQAGNHMLGAQLRYQACNQTQCLPPKTIAVPIDVIGK